MDNKMNHIPKEKFTFVNEGTRLRDKKFDDKPIGYFKDAWIRFRKNKASVVATAIIVLIILFSFVAPLLITGHDAQLMDVYYAKKPARVASLYHMDGFDGGVNQKYTDAKMDYTVAIAIGAMDKDGSGNWTVQGALEGEYSPILEIFGENAVKIEETAGDENPLPGGLPPLGSKPGGSKKKRREYSCTYYMEVDAYLEVGFIYKDVEQAEYDRIVAWQEETGIQVIYPMVDIYNEEYCTDPLDANFWYKADKKGNPVYLDDKGKAVITYYYEGDNFKLEDNYLRDAEGNVRYFQWVGGGDQTTAQKQIRVLYYNYYQYLNGSTPDYVIGTDSQGYDLALRIAGGIKLSLLIAVFVCVVNFILGAMYGAVEGYYGGTVDIVMERISDILANVPFIIVATLFQIHLAKKVGALPCLLFAYVVTGWIGTASRVRTQFYRFKNQEYVMAARTLGARDRRIIWKHIFPNSLGTIITSVALAIPSTIMSESMLSFLGIVNLGTADGTSLGTLLSEANGSWTTFPHLMIYPALVISLLMISFNLFGNGLRDAFNPALRGVED